MTGALGAVRVIDPRHVDITPDQAIGFRANHATDGLSCYLRLLEAVLRSAGYGPAERAIGILHPFDSRLTTVSDIMQNADPSVKWFKPRRCDGAVDRYPGVSCDFTLISQGSYVPEEGHIVGLDAYHLPWHMHFGRRHATGHYCYVRKVSAATVELLDTDADQTGWVRRTDAAVLRQAVAEIGTVRIHELTEPHAGTVSRILDESKKLAALDRTVLQEVRTAVLKEFTEDNFYPVWISIQTQLRSQAMVWATVLDHTGLGDSRRIWSHARYLAAVVTRMATAHAEGRHGAGPGSYGQIVAELLDRQLRFTHYVGEDLHIA